jgi:N utilization substance protein A
MARKLKKFKMDGVEVLDALVAVTKEKNISRELAKESLCDALSQAAKKYLNTNMNIKFDINEADGQLNSYYSSIVVADDEIEDIYKEIPLSEAQEDYGDVEIGEELVEELVVDINAFGRSAIQIAKQIIMQRVREFERKRVFDDFSDRIGELVNGTVQQVERGNVIINLGRTEALLPRSLQIRGERYHQGETVKGVIVEVKDNAKGAQVIISRTDEEFLKRLFEIEIPEVFEGVVKITRVERAPGYRAKVAVETDDPRVDPIGSCVGMRGNRIQSIVRELSNERMDIITWSEDTFLLVRRALASADVKRVFPVGDTRVVVLVADEDLARAIGREGQNIRLTSKFIGKQVDIYGEEEFEDFSEDKKTEILTEDEIEEVDEDLILDDETLGEDEAHAVGSDDDDIDEEDEMMTSSLEIADEDAEAEAPADEDEESEESSDEETELEEKAE